MTVFYGDDRTYFNAFKDENPTSFFGFSSLMKLVKFVENIPEEKTIGERDAGYETDDPAWHGSRNMNEALFLARNGWKYGAKKAIALSEKLTIAHAENKKRLYSVAGGRVSVGRMLSGNPVHMLKPKKIEGKRQVTLFVNVCCNMSIEPYSMIVRASAVAAICNILEMNGYSTEIVSIYGATRFGLVDVQASIVLKKAGNKLNINDIVFGLGHPSFQRRFLFACVCQTDELRTIWKNQGQTVDMFDYSHRPKKNEFDIRILESNIRSADEMLEYITPDGLPITIGE